jgi:RNA polymerase sigma factor (sigma-70 family)
MSGDELNMRLVRRVVRLVGAYVVSEAVRETDLLDVFDITGADENHARAVRAGLAEAGIRVTPSHDVVTRPYAEARRTAAQETGNSKAVRLGPAGPGSAQLPPHHTAITPERPIRGNTTRTDPEIAAARRLLDDDRYSQAPWNRLLSAEEETGLAYLTRGTVQPLNSELPRGFRAALDGHDERARAFDAFVLHNLRLAWSLARDNVGQGLDLADLEQHAVTGLLRAVEKFDATQGHKFSTYATWWIRQAISRSVADEGRLIRLPVHVAEKINKIGRARRRLMASKGRASLFDLSAETGLRPDEITDMLKLSWGVVSLDMQLAQADGATLTDLIEERASHGRDPADVLTAHWNRHEIIEAMGVLTSREATILALRVGLHDDKPQTLEQIGEMFSLTRERIRQIESKAKEHLAPELCRRGLAR